MAIGDWPTPTLVCRFEAKTSAADLAVCFLLVSLSNEQQQVFCFALSGSGWETRAASGHFVHVVMISTVIFK